MTNIYGFDNSMQASENRYLDEDEDIVTEGVICPECKEDRASLLEWDRDGESVTCASCGTVYVP